MAHAQAREVAARLKVAKGDDACAWETLADDMVAGNLASLQGLGARSLAWRAACGTLPLAASPRAIAATWPNVAADLRREYEALRESLVVDPDEAADDGDFDPLGGDPLGAAATGAKAHGSSGAKTGVSNPWEEFHKDKELLEEIRQDLERLYPTGCDDFFMEPAVSKVLQGVLFTWSKLHPDTSYRQGMHELAAPLLYCLHADTTAANRAQTNQQPPALDEAAILIGEALKHVFDATYLEHDLFWLFERVMRDMKPMFAVTSSARSQDDIRKAREAMKQASKRSRALGSGMGQDSRASSYLEGNSDDATAPPLPPILLVAEEIQNVILSKVDGALQQHLSKLTIEPQVYALRWIRLLFGREFPIDQVMVLWDAIFAEAFTLRQRIASSQGDEVQAASIAKGARSAATLTVHDFRLDPDSGGLGLPRIACYFGVALLTYVRKDLLEGGYNEALMMLMKYPEVEDTHVFVHLAFDLRNSLGPRTANPPTIVPPRSMASTTVSRSSGSPNTMSREASASKAMSGPPVASAPSVPLAAPLQTKASSSLSASASTHSAGSRGMQSQRTRTGTSPLTPPPLAPPKRSSPLGSFFREIGETLENMLEPEKAASAAAMATRVENLVAAQRDLGRRLGEITREMKSALSNDAGSTTLSALIDEANLVRDALLQVGSAPAADSIINQV